MAELFPITDTEMEAIRSVERYFQTEMQKDFLAPSEFIQDDVARLSRLLYRLAPYPPAEEVASRPIGEPMARGPIGIVRDHPNHGEGNASQKPLDVDRDSKAAKWRWAKETIGLVAVELNEAYAQFVCEHDGYETPTGALCQVSRRLEEAMQRLDINTELDPIPF